MIFKSNLSLFKKTVRPAGMQSLVAVITLLFVLVGLASSQSKEGSTMSASDLEKIVALEARLNQIVIPSLEFADTPFRDALDFLQSRSVELDIWEIDPPKKGVNIVLSAPEAKDVGITLRLTNVPMIEALRYTTALANTKMTVTPSSVVVVPVTEISDLITEVYPVIPEFLKVDGVEFSAKEVLEGVGVKFEEGSNVVFNPVNSQLIVRNTETQLKRVRAYAVASHAGKRKEFLAEIAKGWEAAPDRDVKLASISFPEIEFQDTPFVDALEFLQAKSVEYDVEEADPAKKGINIILENSGGVKLQKITLKLTNVPLSEALRYTAELGGFTYTDEEHAVVFRLKEKKP